MNKKAIDGFGFSGLAGLLLAVLVAVPSTAAPSLEAPSGAYLAGRHAQETRDYAAAATWFEDALKSDPASPELISRTFLMEASEGRFDRCRGRAHPADRPRQSRRQGRRARTCRGAAGRWRAPLSRPAGAGLDAD